MSYGVGGSSGTTSSSSASIRSRGSWLATTGASARLFCGRCASSRRTWSIASASSRGGECATPLRPVWIAAPPSDSASTSSCVTAFTTLGPVTNM